MSRNEIQWPYTRGSECQGSPPSWQQREWSGPLLRATLWTLWSNDIVTGARDRVKRVWLDKKKACWSTPRDTCADKQPRLENKRFTTSIRDALLRVGQERSAWLTTHYHVSCGMPMARHGQWGDIKDVWGNEVVTDKSLCWADGAQLTTTWFLLLGTRLDCQFVKWLFCLHMQICLHRLLGLQLLFFTVQSGLEFGWFFGIAFLCDPCVCCTILFPHWVFCYWLTLHALKHTGRIRRVLGTRRWAARRELLGINQVQVQGAPRNPQWCSGTLVTEAHPTKSVVFHVAMPSTAAFFYGQREFLGSAFTKKVIAWIFKIWLPRQIASQHPKLWLGY